MSGSGTFTGHDDGLLGMAGKEQGHWGQPHNAAVAGRPWLGGATIGLASPLMGKQGRPYCIAYVKAFAGAAQVPLTIPPEIPFHLVCRVKSFSLD
jgi:hypothetical protein